jgi:hypothetical protein
MLQYRHDLKGTAVCSTSSSVFEHCILDHFKNFLSKSNNQFGSRQTLAVIMRQTLFGSLSIDLSTVVVQLVYAQQTDHDDSSLIRQTTMYF